MFSAMQKIDRKVKVVFVSGFPDSYLVNTALGAGAAGVLVTVLVLAQRSAGGSILIAANDAGNIWVIGASLLAGLTSAWPNISRPAAG